MNHQTNLDRILDIQHNNKFSYQSKNFKTGLSIIILNLNKPNFIIPLLNQLKELIEKFNLSGIGFEVLIGDTGTDDIEVLDFYNSLKDPFIVIKNLKYHFSKNNNEIFYKYVNFNVTLFLNNDILFSNVSNILQFYSTLISNKDYAIVGTVLNFPDNSIQHAGIIFDENSLLPYHAFGGQKSTSIANLDYINSFMAVTGAFLMIKSKVFQIVNGFEEIYQSEIQDIDLCLKVNRIGLESIVLKLDKITHFENGTRKKGEVNEFDRNIYFRRWTNFIKYASNL